MPDLKTGDEVEVFGQRGHVNRIEAIGEEVVRVEVQDSREGKALWQGWFVPDLLTLIAPPAPEPQVGEMWEHVSGKTKLFFYTPNDSALWCVSASGAALLWRDIQDKHFYSKVEA